MYSDVKDVIKMPRSARIKDVYGTYYVTQRSSGCRPLFLDNNDRRFFIDLLQRTVNTFNCRILDYCAQDDEIYHLIIDVNGGDLSKIMKSVNIAYGMHATCEGKLFKDRYVSEPITGFSMLKDVRQRIKDALIENGGYSSFCVSEIHPCEVSDGDHCTDCLSTVEATYDYLESVAQANRMTLQLLLKDKPKRNQLMKEIRRNSTLSLKDIGSVFGGLSESTVCKIISQ